MYKMGITAVLFLLCVSSSRLQAQVETTDSVLYARDSALEIPTDPTTLFFQEAEKTKTPEKVLLIQKNKKTVSLSGFLKKLNGGTPDEPLYADHGFADLDKDGKKELLVYNYTGGAHCCDEIYIFSPAGKNKYLQAGKFFAGNTVIMEDRTFQYDFHEQFGYFFTCFACGVEDSSGRLTGISAITLRLRKGKLQVQPGDSNLLSLIRKNLELLGRLPYAAIDPDLLQDDGLRKEIALNLAVYFYSYGRNLGTTQALFKRYYTHPDAGRIWSQFRRQLGYIQQANDF